MESTDDLRYSSEAVETEYLFFCDLNDINIFVEDEGKEFEYETIFKRLLGKKYKITKTSSIELLIDAISEDNESDKEEYLKLVFQSNEESQEELNTLMNKNFIEVTYLCLKTYISV